MQQFLTTNGLLSYHSLSIRQHQLNLLIPSLRDWLIIDMFLIDFSNYSFHFLLKFVCKFNNKTFSSLNKITKYPAAACSHIVKKVSQVYLHRARVLCIQHPSRGNKVQTISSKFSPHDEKKGSVIEPYSSMPRINVYQQCLDTPTSLRPLSSSVRLARNRPADWRYFGKPRGRSTGT